MVVRNDQATVDELLRVEPDGIVISPGPGRPADAGITEALIREAGARLPILGVCLGHQAIAEVYGGQIVAAPEPVHGKPCDVHHDGRGVFDQVAQPFVATRYHSLVVEPSALPDVLCVSARTADGVIMGLRHREHPIVGIQFHPESLLTTEGPRIIQNWVASVASGDFTEMK